MNKLLLSYFISGMLIIGFIVYLETNSSDEIWIEIKADKTFVDITKFDSFNLKAVRVERPNSGYDVYKLTNPSEYDKHVIVLPGDDMALLYTSSQSENENFINYFIYKAHVNEPLPE